jgi:O-antigen ligase
VILLIIRLLHEGHNPLQVFIRNNPFFKPLLIFLVGAFLSLINSSDLGAAATAMGKYIFLFGFWLPAGIYLLNTPQRVKFMLIVLIAATLIPLIPAICDYYFQTRMTVIIDRILSMNLEHNIPHLGRFGSVMGHPNNLGNILIVIFPFSFWLIYFGRTLSIKLSGILFLCLLLVGSLVTASRSSVGAMIIQTIFFITFVPQLKLNQKIAYAFFLFVFISIVLLVVVKARPVILFDRFVEMSSYEFGEYEPDLERIEYISEAWHAILAHPLSGTGVENTVPNLEVFGVHNTILRLWVGIGALGLIFICWIYLLAFHTAFINIFLAVKYKIYDFAPIAFLYLVSFIGWFLVDMVQPQFHNRFKFITLIMLFSHSGIINFGKRTTSSLKREIL